MVKTYNSTRLTLRVLFVMAAEGIVRASLELGVRIVDVLHHRYELVRESEERHVDVLRDRLACHAQVDGGGGRLGLHVVHGKLDGPHALTPPVCRHL